MYTAKCSSFKVIIWTVDDGRTSFAGLFSAAYKIANCAKTRRTDKIEVFYNIKFVGVSITVCVAIRFPIGPTLRK